MRLHASGRGRDWGSWGRTKMRIGLGRRKGAKKAFVPSSHILFTKRLRTNSAARSWISKIGALFTYDGA